MTTGKWILMLYWVSSSVKRMCCLPSQPRAVTDVLQNSHDWNRDSCGIPAGLEGPLIGLFENAAMIVLLAALMLFSAFWLPFTIGRCAQMRCLLPTNPAMHSWLSI